MNRNRSGHFVTIRLVYLDNRNGGRTPWKRRGVCRCGWVVLSWDPFRAINLATAHVRQRAGL